MSTPIPVRMPARTYSTWRCRWSTKKQTKSWPSFTPTIAGTRGSPLGIERRRSDAAYVAIDLIFTGVLAMSDHTYLRITKLALGAVLLASASLALAQPRFGNPSPTAGSDTSQKANASADQALYQPVVYANANKRGPAVIVIPGEIKSNNATFLQKFTSNNIADFGEVELSSANFPVLERSNLGPLLKEFALAYNLGDPDSARKMLHSGRVGRPPAPAWARCRPASRAACGSSACATRSSMRRPPSRWRRDTRRRKWKSAQSRPRFSVYRNP